MKTKYALAVVMFLVAVCKGQINLVPNPGFENYVQCPVSINQSITTTSWSSYGGTSDYYNSCANANFCGVSVPFNMGGIQNAASGNAYCGFIAYMNPSVLGTGNVREYIGTQLISPLVVGKKYYVSFKVSLAEGSCFDFNIACNKLGVRFITYNLPYLSLPAVPNAAHVFTNTIISDTSNWVKVQGSFIADSAYNRILCGNFFNDINTSTLSIGSPAKQAYYYIDDVVVSTDSLSEITGLEETQTEVAEVISPNPATDYITIKIPDQALYAKFTMYDAMGKQVLSVLLSDKTTINTEGIQNGLYVAQIVTNKRTSYYRVLVRH